MHGQRFTEGAGFSHEYAAALAQGTVDGFDDARTAAALGASAVVPAGQYADICFPQVGEVPAMAVVTRRQRLPQAPSRGRITPAQHPSHDAPAGPFDGQPQPDLALLVADEGSHLIQFQRPPLLFLFPFGPQAGQRGWSRLRFFYPTGNPHVRDARQAGNAALRIARAQQLVHLRVLHRFGHGSRLKSGVKRAWWPQPLHWYLACPPALPLRRMCSLPQAAQKCCVKTIPQIKRFTLDYPTAFFRSYTSGMTGGKGNMVRYLLNTRQGIQHLQTFRASSRLLLN